MTPVKCRVRHEPPNSYGDCVRACIASILDMDAENVPHFYDDNPTDKTGRTRVNQWLLTQGLAAMFTAWDGSASLNEILDMMADNAPYAHYMLYGSTADGGQHVVVCRGGDIVHNPAWYGCDLIGPTDQNTWVAMVIARA